VRRQDVVVSVPAVGNLQYVNKIDLPSISGEKVVSVEVITGDIVKKGQVLVTLVPSTRELAVIKATISLRDAEKLLLESLKLPASEAFYQAEEAVSYAQHKMGSTNERLKRSGAGPTDPELAQAKSNLLAATFAIQEAQQGLERMTGRPKPLELAKARQAKAAAQADLKEAEETLANFAQDHIQKLVKARQDKADAAAALRDAEKALGNFDREHSKQLILARRAKADAELVLKDAKKALNDLFLEPTKQLILARRAKADAELVLKEAKTALSDFFSALGGKIAFNEAAIDELHRLQEAVELAQADVDQAVANLVEAQQGPNQSAVGGTIAFNETAVDQLNRLKEAVELAQADADRALADLVEKQQGPNQLGRQQLQTAMDLAQVNLRKAEESLADLDVERGLPEVALQKGKIAAAKAELRAIEEALAALKPQANSRDIALLEVKATAVQAELATSAQVLAAREARANPMKVASLEAQVVLARAKLVEAKEALAALERRPDPSKLGLEERQTELLLTTLQQVYDRLASLVLGVASEGLPQVQSGLKEAEERLLEVVEQLRRMKENAGSLDVALRRKEVEVAQDKLAEAEDNLRNATIVAPFDGLVSATRVVKGQRVLDSSSPIQLLDTSALAVVAQVTETDVAQVKQGQEANIRIKALPGTVLRGKLTSISSTSTPTVLSAGAAGKASYEVVISGDDLRSAGLSAGMTATAEIIIDQRVNVLAVPVGALSGDERSAEVEVVAEGEVARVSVKTGLKNTHLVELMEGLQEGAVVRVNRAKGGFPGKY
jgi:HlyD family secretion protein